ncbi:MAG: phenylalanine--tRNA ligase subunit beta [bacterium]
MKILYSQIKELVPSLKANAREVGEALTTTGFLLDGLEKVRYNGKADSLLSFEVRQNRPDCLSVIGLAKETAAYYGLKIKLPLVSVRYPKTGKLNVGVDAPKHVKRAFAIEIDGLKNSKSPQWLKNFLAFYNINSINFLVDLSNYVMIITGYPSHLLDKEKITGRFFWALNKDFTEITTLDGSRIFLNNKNELLIRDEKNVLGLAGIVGGKAAMLGLKTTAIIAEMAIYDRALIRRNARDLKITTEASIRLEKDLDQNGLDYAFGLLISLILENCGGKILTAPFSYQPKKYVAPVITFDPSLPSIYAGVEIPRARTIAILKNLGFKIKEAKTSLSVIPPQGRMDVAVKQDLVEEVLRTFGYQNIPREVPALKVVTDITPIKIYLTETIKNILSSLGFDEVLSCPLTKKEANFSANYRLWENISTQNSVNEDYPDLRQTIAVGLFAQLNEYLKKNVSIIKIYEIGKVFGKKGDKYEENEALGILLQTKAKSIKEFKAVVETLLRSIGLADIVYLAASNKPRIANPYSVWDISANNKTVGILYKLKNQGQGNVYFCEINIFALVEILKNVHLNPVVELTEKLVVLDANVELGRDQAIIDFLKEIKKMISSKNIWSIDVYDVFPLEGKKKIRYTVRVSYKGLDDQKAKEIHLKAFGLENIAK